MIFAFFFLQSISIAYTLGTVTKVYDIETVIRSYVSHSIDEHALHATSNHYMQMVQDESHLTSRYLQSVRYILHGFPITNEANDNDTVYKKLNFIQSIAYYYCGINMSDVMSATLDNIFVDESQLYMNSVIFPVQLVESYELVRSEICERIKLGLYQSVIDMFNQYGYADPFFGRFIRNVANFISSKEHEFLSLQRIGDMYPFLAKFGEFELYKETVIDQIWKIDNMWRKSKILDKIQFDIDTCVSQIKHPKMHKYVTDILKSTGNKSFILNQHNTSDFWHHVQLYQLSTASAAVSHHAENDTIKVRNLLQLLDECRLKPKFLLTGTSMAACRLITFGIYESCEDRMNGHEYVLNAIKCIISNHDLYYSKFGPLTNEMDYKFKSQLTNSLRKSLSEADIYLYLNELMNDTQFVNIVNNNTDSEIDTYLQKILSELMVHALEQHKDIQMIKKIAIVFKPKINVYAKCIDYPLNLRMISWMDVLMKHECMYLETYFQQRFKHQEDDCSLNLV